VFPALRFGPVEVSTYVLTISLAGLLGFWRTYRIVRSRSDASAMLTLTMIAFCAGLLGARALSVLLNRPFYTEEPWSSWLAFWDRSGMALYGGLALASVAGVAYARAGRLPAWEASDVLVIAWSPSLALVRVGCFLNGCCYGIPTTSPLGLVAGGPPNAVNFHIPSHPTQLYDAVAILVIFALATQLWRRRAFPGQVTLCFLGLYSAFRVYHETLRGDPRLAWRVAPLGTVTFNQVASAVLLAVALGAYAYLSRRSRDLARPAAPESVPTFRASAAQPEGQTNAQRQRQ